MGMYTQIRGWLNVGSISSMQEREAEEGIAQARKLFAVKTKELELARPWVSEDTHVVFGSNGAAWIFFGAELKNYDESFDEWFKCVIEAFPFAEGRLDYQYEEESPGESDCRVVKVYKGKIISDTREPAWCNGYENGPDL